MKLKKTKLEANEQEYIEAHCSWVVIADDHQHLWDHYRLDEAVAITRIDGLWQVNLMMAAKNHHDTEPYITNIESTEEARRLAELAYAENY